MVLKLYGHIYSTSTQRVILVLHELSVPYEFINVEVCGGNLKDGSPENPVKHPFGSLPYIEEDGFELFESRAICRFIVAKYYPDGSSLLPTELQAAALFEQAASVERSYFDVHANVVLQEKFLKKYQNQEFDEARYAQALKKIESTLDVYDAILCKQKYLAGDQLTLVDLFHLPLLKVVGYVAPETFKKRANVDRWWTELVSRPSAKALTEVIRIRGSRGLDCS